MQFADFQGRAESQVHDKDIFADAQRYAYEYMDRVAAMDVFPSPESLALLDAFSGPMPDGPGLPQDIIKMLHDAGSPNTVAQTGGRYFGFVNGGAAPAGIAAKWLADVWDQNAALYVMSPIASKLEEVCEQWVVDLLGLPAGTAAGFVSGSSTANLCGLAVARNVLLGKYGWDAGLRGLAGAPPIRVVAGEQAHASVGKALALLGIGASTIEIVPTDDQGRMRPDAVPPLDSTTLLILQAGNVSGGAFDPVDELCDLAHEAGAWVHVDGAFGLWAAACERTRHLTRGIEKADSWAVDAHKTLNAPYDCGIVLCKDRQFLADALQSTGSYLEFSDHRDGMLYTPEMSRPARSVALWATLKSLGRSGVDTLIGHLCQMTRRFADGLARHGFIIDNEVVFNQILVRCQQADDTVRLLDRIQASGRCWCGGAVRNGEPVIRISVCSWRTTSDDVDECVELFAECL